MVRKWLIQCRQRMHLVAEIKKKVSNEKRLCEYLTAAHIPYQFIASLADTRYQRQSYIWFVYTDLDAFLSFNVTTISVDDLSEAQVRQYKINTLVGVRFLKTL